MSRTIKVYNSFHLGDQIWNFILFYNIKNFIEENDIFIDYRCDKQYHNQLSEFNVSKNINIQEISTEEDNGIHLWIGNKNDFKNNFFDSSNSPPFYYDIFYLKFANEFLQKVVIPIVIEKLEYEDPDLLSRYEKLSGSYDFKYSEVDILILNSTSLSNQYDMDKNKWDSFILKLNEKYKVVTSEKVEGVNCSQDDKLTVKDIAALSTRCKKIIAVNSGVVPGLFNKYTLDNVEIVYFFVKDLDYDHPKFKKTNDTDDLYFLLDKSEGFENVQYINTTTLFTFLILSLGIIAFYNISKKFRCFKKYLRSNKK